MYLVFDIGGTKMRLATAKNLEELSEIKEALTPPDFESAMQQFETLAKELTKGQAVTKCAGCVPGPLNAQKDRLVGAPNLPLWKGQPLAERISQILGCPVILENDAATAGLGEAVLGAGKGKNIVAYYTVSTGIGGARIVDGKIDVSSRGFEPGQQIIDAGGSLESYASGKALEKRFGNKSNEIKDEKVWEELALWLAYGVFNGIVHWSPDVVVLGGPMVLKKPGIDIKKVEENLKKINNIFPDLPPIVLAELKSESGLYGCLKLLS